MPAITGEEYIRRIDALESEVWIDGERIQGNISQHSAFQGVIQSQAELYDIQHSQAEEMMTFSSDTTGHQIGTSYLIPKTKQDLQARRKMIQRWARHTGGLMGRSPDYMNTVLASYAASANILEGEENCFPERLRSFYEYAREHDLSFTHTFLKPQSNRSTLSVLDEDVTNAKIVKSTDEGIIIKGAKLLATQGGITDEIIVLSAPGGIEEAEAYAFSIPSNTPGLKFVARESFVTGKSRFNAPLSSRFEEMDTIVLFDDVLVPWERVFIYKNIKAMDDLYKKGKFTPFTLHQIVSRQVIKIELLLGIAQIIVETINISEYQHVQSKVTEIIKGLETMQALLIYSEEQGLIEESTGVYIPARQPLYIAINQFQELYPRFTEILQQLGASGMMTIPTESDFESSIGADLKNYLQATDKNGKERVRLFRLAWDISMSAFGARQTLYERFFFGDPVRLSQTIYHTYDKQPACTFAEKFMKE
ncbi:4-hydroxyphenylacetate 3-monooxygenase, oxygenase component [Pontibacillus yanchengensis]|uniref:4-hydroxyphenylacetate 3-monooxygenase n=1 Tax=Pontibacillus yanchengensis Y32 TaxID=1385514 RepID=A0A0A2TT25_9BACI|nr:4-hydroxyphenylacetate 3-monooxygenase, oxygenase component [Pontibacillus yanchengensis]KGP72395.1 4-hydroxyphenylacetate 3-monooxygenase [Pontibacillus yanchengensis Y32]